MTVDKYKSNYMTFQLLYAFHQTPFGKCLIAVTDIDEDVAYLTFFDDEASALADLKVKWPLTRISEDTENKTDAVVAKIFHPDDPQLRTVHVIMKGTEFQIKVWRSLTEIPIGTVTTYEKVAQMVDCNPKAAIAVGNAISKNYVAYIIPCHRVIAKNMRLQGTKYAWGSERKVAILEYEKKQLLL